MSIDNARNWLNQNSAPVTVCAIAVLIGAMVFIVKSGKRGSGNNQPGEAWYYDVTDKVYFKDKTTRVAPFTRDENGNTAVRAHFFTCGECTESTVEGGGERFLGYYEKYTEEVRAKLEEKSESFALYEMAFQGRLYSVDGEKWYAAEKEEGTSITADLQKKCPPKKLRYCPPQ